jgi:uncharacterized protein (TIGR02246 family)
VGSSPLAKQLDSATVHRVTGTAPFARTPDECDRMFAAFVSAGDLDGLVQLYESDARYVQRDGAVLCGHEQIRHVLAPLTYSPTTLDMRIVRLVEAAGIAVVYNDWSLRTTTAGTAVQRYGKAVEIVRRDANGRWLFAIDDPFGRDP